MFSGCCGQPAGRPRKESAEPLPDNPDVHHGVELLYLGAGRRDFEGSATGFVYVVSDRRRAFTAHSDDARALLRNRFVIEAP